MIKPRCLLLNGIFWLVWTIALTSLSATEDPTRNLTTAAARRAALAERLSQRPEVEASGDRAALVQLNNEIVQLYLKLWDMNSAAQEAQCALDVAEQLAGSANASLLVDTLVLSARVHIRRNEIPAAMAQLERAVQLSRDLHYRDGEACALSQLASAHMEADERDKAADLTNDALTIWQELPNKPLEAEALIRKGEIYMIASDRAAEVTAVLQQAEAICRSLNDLPCLATSLMDLGYQAIREGQWQTALSFFNQVEDLQIENEAEPYIAGQIAMGFGLVYEAYGQLETARDYVADSLTYYRDGAHDKRAASDAGSKLARILAVLHDYTAAHQRAQESLTSALETGNNLSIGLSHESFGRVWLEQRDYEAARSEFNSAIDYFTQSKTGWALARAQLYLGNTEQLLGNSTAAVNAYNKASRYFEEQHDYTNEAAVCFGLGKLALNNGQLPLAKDKLERSINLTEQMREYAWSKDLRSAFLASVHDRYRTYVELLMKLKEKERNPRLEIDAFEINEAGRARALIDSLHVLGELRQPKDRALVPKEQDLLGEEQKLVDARAQLTGKEDSDKEKADVERQLTDVRSRLEALEADLKTNARFDDLLRSKPLKYEEIRNELTDADTSLLSYSLGTEKSFAWLITKDGLQSFELGNRETIDKAATQLVRLLKLPPEEVTDQAELQTSIDEVSRLVVQPIADKLKTSRLIVVADGSLQYVPFQILKKSPGAGDPLIASMNIVNEPSASALALVRRQRRTAERGGKLLVGFGDAIFSPEYATGVASDADANQTTRTRSAQASRFTKLPPLFNAKHELLAISEMTGNDSTFFVEHQASRENLLKVDLSQFRILHVLTHGVLNAQQPEMSGLVLSLVDENKQSIPGFVSLADIYHLRAPELVVLSACDTALGESLDGEGLVGVTRGFMYAGASGVVASLWKVDDDSTTELMKYFYANMLQQGMSPAAALRNAQMKIRSQPKWRSPYYWAGFVFQGNDDLNIRVVPTRAPSYRILIAGGPVFIIVLAVLYWAWLRRRTRATS